jgi:hypothetical protein
MEPSEELLESASLRFPGAVNNGNLGFGDSFVDGGAAKTSGGVGVESPIPEPPQSVLDAAAAKGIDEKTGKLTQPAWLSVLKKRETPFMLVRLLTCNCCFQKTWSITRAQWIWALNFACFASYLAWALQIGMQSFKEGKGDTMAVSVWRLQFLWNSTLPDAHTAVLVDNQQPIRVDVVVGAIFVVSTIVQFAAVVAGPFDRFIIVYWRNLDLCFHYWRWIDMLVTMPLMGMALCLLVQLREANALALVWMLFSCTVACFFLVEVWSRPHRGVDSRYDMSRWMGEDPVVQPGVPLVRLSATDVAARTHRAVQRNRLYYMRVLPATLGLFPFVAAWVVILNAFFTQLYDTRLGEGGDVYDRTPEFMHRLVLLTLAMQSLYFIPLFWYQYMPPMHYWKTDVIYTVLALATKMFFGITVLDNVIRKTSFDAALALNQAAVAVTNVTVN